MGNWKSLPQHGKPNPALSLNAKAFYRKKLAPPLSGVKYPGAKEPVELLILKVDIMFIILIRASEPFTPSRDMS